MTTSGLLPDRPMSLWWSEKEKCLCGFCVIVFVSTDTTLPVWRFVFISPRQRQISTKHPPAAVIWCHSSQAEFHRKSRPFCVFPVKFDFNVENFPLLKHKYFPPIAVRTNLASLFQLSPRKPQTTSFCWYRFPYPSFITPVVSKYGVQSPNLPQGARSHFLHYQLIAGPASRCMYVTALQVELIT